MKLFFFLLSSALVNALTFSPGLPPNATHDYCASASTPCYQGFLQEGEKVVSHFCYIFFEDILDAPPEGMEILNKCLSLEKEVAAILQINPIFDGTGCDWDSSDYRAWRCYAKVSSLSMASCGRFQRAWQKTVRQCSIEKAKVGTVATIFLSLGSVCGFFFFVMVFRTAYRECFLPYLEKRRAFREESQSLHVDPFRPTILVINPQEKFQAGVQVD